MASVQGVTTLDEAKRIAESVVRVEADEPLLVGAREEQQRDVPAS